MNKEKLIKFILKLYKIRNEAIEIDIDIDDELDDVITELTMGIYPAYFNEEFPTEKFYEKD